MSLITYEDVRPWARAIKTRTGIGPRAGRDAAVVRREEHRHPGLQGRSVAERGGDRQDREWADSGAPRGNPADMPPARVFDDDTVWRIGKPDLIVKTKDVIVKANAPDWWGEIESVPIGLNEDRYVSAIEIKEVNDVPNAGNGRHTVGGRFVFHHMIWSTRVLDRIGERDVARCRTTRTAPAGRFTKSAATPTIFDPRAARLLRAGSQRRVELGASPLERPRHQGAPRDRLQVRIRRATSRCIAARSVSLGNGVDIDIKPMEANQQLHAYAVLQEHTKIVTFEPHLHAPGMRMCLEAIWGINIQTLTCAGYDHNWVRGYAYDDDHAPLLPKGTILHIIGYMDNSPANKNIPDPRNWQGSGNRSVANMFIDLGQRRGAHRRAVRGRDGRAAREAEADAERLRHRLPAVPERRRRARRRRRILRPAASRQPLPARIVACGGDSTVGRPFRCCIRRRGGLSGRTALILSG